MFCSTCGNEINRKLNYCKRCGARVENLKKSNGGAAAEKSEALEYLSMASGFVGLGGLGLTVGLIAILLKFAVPPTVIVIITLAFLSAVFGICFLTIRQISTMTNSILGERLSEKASQPQIAAADTGQLEEFRRPARSVTENTTRTLDKTQI